MYVIQMKKRRRLRIAPKKYVMRMKLVMVTIVVAVLPVIGHRNDAMIGCDGLMLILMYKEHHGSRQRQKKRRDVIKVGVQDVEKESKRRRRSEMTLWVSIAASS